MFYERIESSPNNLSKNIKKCIFTNTIYRGKIHKTKDNFV